MGIFSEIFKSKDENNIEKVTENLREWVQKHFCNSCYYGENFRYSVYKADSGEKIQLQKLKVPFIQNQQSDTVPKKLKEVINFISRKSLPEFISEYHTNISSEIKKYNANCVKLKNLSDDLQKYSLFDEMKHIFSEKLKILYNELLFCKFDKLNDADYFRKIYKKLIALYDDMKNINNYFADYMYALTNTEYEDTSCDIEQIRISVETMAELTKNL